MGMCLQIRGSCGHGGSPMADRGTTGATAERLAPYIANSVFTLELYLKCLLMRVTGKYAQVHSAQALFFDLPSDEIHRLRNLHRQI